VDFEVEVGGISCKLQQTAKKEFGSDLRERVMMMKN
jgi:hypothetical protein